MSPIYRNALKHCGRILHPTQVSRWSLLRWYSKRNQRSWLPNCMHCKSNYNYIWSFELTFHRSADKCPEVSRVPDCSINQNFVWHPLLIIFDSGTFPLMIMYNVPSRTYNLDKSFNLFRVHTCNYSNSFRTF